jgi:hypothetical protein
MSGYGDNPEQEKHYPPMNADKIERQRNAG